MRLIAFLCMILATCTALSEDINFDDLRRAGRPLSKTFPIPGTAAEGQQYFQQFAQSDGARVEQHKQQAAEAQSAAASAAQYCNSSDTCFEVVSSSKDEVTIRCVKGSQYKIGQTYKICGPNNKGNWASGCGITDTFAYHYSFKKAGNLACE